LFSTALWNAAEKWGKSCEKKQAGFEDFGRFFGGKAVKGRCKGCAKAGKNEKRMLSRSPFVEKGKVLTEKMHYIIKV
jgi:hypothetical protein